MGWLQTDYLESADSILTLFPVRGNRYL
jgi:hypothetical protein